MTGKTFIITRRIKLLSHAFNIGTERPILASPVHLLCDEGPMDKNGYVHNAYFSDGFGYTPTQDSPLGINGRWGECELSLSRAHDTGDSPEADYPKMSVFFVFATCETPDIECLE